MRVGGGTGVLGSLNVQNCYMRELAGDYMLAI